MFLNRHSNFQFTKWVKNKGMLADVHATNYVLRPTILQTNVLMVPFLYLDEYVSGELTLLECVCAFMIIIRIRIASSTS